MASEEEKPQKEEIQRKWRRKVAVDRRKKAKNLKFATTAAALIEKYKPKKAGEREEILEIQGLLDSLDEKTKTYKKLEGNLDVFLSKTKPVRLTAQAVHSRLRRGLPAEGPLPALTGSPKHIPSAVELQNSDSPGDMLRSSGIRYGPEVERVISQVDPLTGDVVFHRTAEEEFPTQMKIVQDKAAEAVKVKRKEKMADMLDKIERDSRLQIQLVWAELKQKVPKYENPDKTPKMEKLRRNAVRDIEQFRKVDELILDAAHENAQSRTRDRRVRQKLILAKKMFKAKRNARSSGGGLGSMLRRAVAKPASPTPSQDKGGWNTFFGGAKPAKQAAVVSKPTGGGITVFSRMLAQKKAEKELYHHGDLDASDASLYKSPLHKAAVPTSPLYKPGKPFSQPPPKLPEHGVANSKGAVVRNKKSGEEKDPEQGADDQVKQTPTEGVRQPKQLCIAQKLGGLRSPPARRAKVFASSFGSSHAVRQDAVEKVDASRIDHFLATSEVDGKTSYFSVANAMANQADRVGLGSSANKPQGFRDFTRSPSKRTMELLGDDEAIGIPVSFKPDATQDAHLNTEHIRELIMVTKAKQRNSEAEVRAEAAQGFVSEALTNPSVQRLFETKRTLGPVEATEKIQSWWKMLDKRRTFKKQKKAALLIERFYMKRYDTIFGPRLWSYVKEVILDKNLTQEERRARDQIQGRRRSQMTGVHDVVKAIPVVGKADRKRHSVACGGGSEVPLLQGSLGLTVEEALKGFQFGSPMITGKKPDFKNRVRRVSVMLDLLASARAKREKMDMRRRGRRGSGDAVRATPRRVSIHTAENSYEREMTLPKTEEEVTMDDQYSARSNVSSKITTRRARRTSGGMAPLRRRRGHSTSGHDAKSDMLMMGHTLRSELGRLRLEGMTQMGVTKSNFTSKLDDIGEFISSDRVSAKDSVNELKELGSSRGAKSRQSRTVSPILELPPVDGAVKF